jgi:hypothetical protein
VAIGGGFGQEAERGAAIRCDQLCSRGGSPRLFAEQRESELVARIEKRDGVFALSRSFRNPLHFFGVGAVLRGDSLAPSRRFRER